MRTFIIMNLLVFMLAATQASALSTAQIKAKIIADSIEAYLATGAVCPCPYNKDKYLQPCGDFNAYTASKGRPGNFYCYPADVPNSAVERYRNSH